MAFAYRHVEATLAELHSIQGAKRTAFKARLKHLQRLGFPAGVNTGTGKAAEYTAPQILLIGMALELLQLGLTPERVVRFLVDQEGAVAAAVRGSLQNAGKEWPPYFLWFDPFGLNELSATTPVDQALSTVDVGDAEKLFEQVSRTDVLWPRLSIINISTLMRGIYLIFRRSMTETAVPFVADLRAWVGSEAPDGCDQKA